MRTDNSDAIIEQLKNDAVSEVSPELRESAKQKISKASLIWNLFYGDYKFSLYDFQQILNKLEK